MQSNCADNISHPRQRTPGARWGRLDSRRPSRHVTQLRKSTKAASVFSTGRGSQGSGRHAVRQAGRLVAGAAGARRRLRSVPRDSYKLQKAAETRKLHRGQGRRNGEITFRPVRSRRHLQNKKLFFLFIIKTCDVSTNAKHV
ncbi:unnamed protein product [Ixodes pacificus]